MQIAACRALRKLCASEVNRAAFIDGKGVEPLLRAMEVWLHTNGGRCKLSRCCAFQVHKNDSLLVLHAMATMAAVGDSQENRLAVGTLSPYVPQHNFRSCQLGPSCVVHSLRAVCDHSDEAEVVRYGLRACKSLTFNCVENQSAFLEEGSET